MNEQSDKEIEEIARAKINLDLLIVGKRPDGYHELDSLVVFAQCADRIRIEPSRDIELSISGPFAGAIDVPREHNLVVRAARMFRAFIRTEQGARIHLEKNLPVAAGLGGGTADAAACLRGLNRFWRARRDDFVLRELSLELGADMPACMYSRAARMRGLGERVDPVTKMPELWLVLINPVKPLATPNVFGALQPADRRPRPRGFPSHPSITQLGYWLSYTRNDLEAPAIALMPGIQEMLDAMSRIDDCILARMSGSGPTCFGLFPDEQKCLAHATSLRRRFPDFWVVVTKACAEPRRNGCNL